MFDNWFAFHVARNDTELPSASPFAHHQHMIPSPASQSLVAVRKGIGRHAPRWREQWRRRYDFRCQQLKVICSGIPSVLPPRCPPEGDMGRKRRTRSISRLPLLMDVYSQECPKPKPFRTTHWSSPHHHHRFSLGVNPPPLFPHLPTDSSFHRPIGHEPRFL